MTEEQRRALFALREALRLCEGARVRVESHGGYDGECILHFELNRDKWFAICSEQVDEFLALYPEDEAE